MSKSHDKQSRAKDRRKYNREHKPASLQGHSERQEHVLVGNHETEKRGANTLAFQSSGPAERYGSPNAGTTHIAPNPMDRRMFLATAALVMLGVPPALQTTAEIAMIIGEKMGQRREAATREDELHELLNCYLYPSIPGRRLESRVPLVPAMRDPWGPANRRFSGSGNAVSAAYIAAFRVWRDPRVVEQIKVEDDDAPVLIASHLTNERAAECFGDPSADRPIHRPHHRDSVGRIRSRAPLGHLHSQGCKSNDQA